MTQIEQFPIASPGQLDETMMQAGPEALAQQIINPAEATYHDSASVEPSQQPAVEVTTENNLVTDAHQRLIAESANNYHDRVEISPRHHMDHLQKASFVQGIEDRPENEQDLIGELIEIGSSAIIESTTEKSSLAQELTDIPDKLKPRIAEAINDSEFVASPELSGAIEGYYVDHNRLAAAVEGVIAKTMTNEDAQKIIDGEFDGGSYVMNTALKELVEGYGIAEKRNETLQQAEKIVSSVLFNEVCVGAMTVKPEDTQVVSVLYEKVRETADQEGMNVRTVSQESFDSKLEARTKRLHEEAWDDTRHAGQLLFHNTPFMNDIVLQGGEAGTVPYSITSRSNRQQTGAELKATTVVGPEGYDMHTNVPHWSERFIPFAYKTVMGSNKEYKGDSPATIAVPLAELIKTSPYGRDNEYAVVSLKPGEPHHEIPINEDVNPRDDHVGNRDLMGRDGDDRVFFADATDPYKGHNYVVDFGKGMSTENGNTSSIIRLQGDYNSPVFSADGKDLVRLPGELPQYGMGQNIPNMRTFAYDYRPPGSSPYNVGQKKFEYFTPKAMEQFGMPFRRGEGLPADENGSFRGGMSKEAQQAELAQEIAQLQQESRSLPQFENKVVVPLRQGVISYINEAKNGDRAFGGVGDGMRQQHQANIYNTAA
jgi:hypothetical protein